MTFGLYSGDRIEFVPDRGLDMSSVVVQGAIDEATGRLCESLGLDRPVPTDESYSQLEIDWDPPLRRVP